MLITWIFEHVSESEYINSAAVKKAAIQNSYNCSKVILKYLPIIPPIIRQDALMAYYSQNYVGILGRSALVAINTCNKLSVGAIIVSHAQ